MIAAWLRERRPNDYERLVGKDVFVQLAALREARTSFDIKVEFRLRVNTLDKSTTVTHPLFWDRTRNILIYGAEPKKSQIAKTIARGLIENQPYKDLAHWIELVLGASDTERLRDENWDVPKEIRDLFPRIAPVPNVPEPSLVAAAEATVSQPASEAAAPPASQPVQATSPQEPAPEQANDLVGASKGDIRPQTPVTFLNNTCFTPGWSGRTEKAATTSLRRNP